MLWFANSFPGIILDANLCCQPQDSTIISPEWAGVIVASVALIATIFSSWWQIRESKKAEKARNAESEKLERIRHDEARAVEQRRIQDLERLERQRKEDQLRISEARRLNIRADWFKNHIYLPNKEAMDAYFSSLKEICESIDQINTTTEEALEIDHRLKTLTKNFLDKLIEDLGPFDQEFYLAVRNKSQKLESEMIGGLYEKVDGVANQEMRMPNSLKDSVKEFRLVILKWVYNYRGDFKADFPEHR
jgi:hypothetical protein